MWQFAEAVRGLGDACRALGTPVTGGNVSFYNEAGDSAIWPTPIIGMLGVIDDYRLRTPSGFPGPGHVVYLLGETFAELGGSEFAEVVLGTIAGAPPALDLDRERALIEVLVEGSRQDLLASAHDCSDGGLAVALAESAIVGDTGFAISMPGDLPWHVTLFAESASRAVVTVTAENAARLEDLARGTDTPFARLGETGGTRMGFDSLFEATVTKAREAYERAIPSLLEASPATASA